MLEHASLFLLPWHARGDRRAWILDPRSSAPLGFVCRRRRKGPFAWLCWWRRTFLAIHESEDEPLLLTIQPSFGPWKAWLVRDADDHLVGQIWGHRLHDGIKDPLAVLHPGERGAASYRSVGHEDLAVMAREEDGVRLTFLMEEGSSPFVKMVLLAAALVHNQDALAGSPCSPASPSLPTRTS
jgi:hypothetical protein